MNESNFQTIEMKKAFYMGKVEGKKEIARKMVNAGMTNEDIYYFTGISPFEYETKEQIPQANDDLRECLLRWRTERYKAENVRAYMILHQKTLNEIAYKMPKTKDELMNIFGFGKVKWEKYGEEILKIISDVQNGTGYGQSGQQSGQQFSQHGSETSTGFETVAPFWNAIRIEFRAAIRAPLWTLFRIASRTPNILKG